MVYEKKTIHFRQTVLPHGSMVEIATWVDKNKGEITIFHHFFNSQSTTSIQCHGHVKVRFVPWSSHMVMKYGLWPFLPWEPLHWHHNSRGDFCICIYIYMEYIMWSHGNIWNILYIQYHNFPHHHLSWETRRRFKTHATAPPPIPRRWASWRRPRLEIHTSTPENALEIIGFH